jgi:beta-glucosidase/6-phospho-beta-glucosidase/beta-galactosidase
MDTNILPFSKHRFEHLTEAGAYNRIGSPGWEGSNPFRSFWMAGFECTDKLNAFGNRVDLLNSTGHLQLIEEDYKNLSLFSMRTVREGARWSQVEKTPYEYDWSVVEKMIIAAREQGIQQLWDICHFGFPDDLTPLHPMFARRFAAFCKAFVNFYRSMDRESTLVITPINEVSFLSWLGGDVRGTSPYCVGQGWEVKYRLMKAYIEGIEAAKEADPSVRILTTEPMVNIVPPENAGPEEIHAATCQHEFQFQVTDMLSGIMCPELRGKPEYLDLLGVNYYYTNQWVVGTNELLKWGKDATGSRFVPVRKLLTNVHRRYQRPLVVTETSHPKEDRPLWIEMITRECAAAMADGVPLLGICWYPVIDRPDWDNLAQWHQSGLWDGEFQPGEPNRVLHLPTARALSKAQLQLQNMFPFTIAGKRYACL